MTYHFAGRSPVCHYQTIKSPLATKHILQNESISGRGYPIIIIKGSHKRSCTRFRCRFKRWQVNIAQTTFRNKCRIIVTPAFGCTITHKMFRTGSYGSGTIQRISLKTFYHGSSHYRSQIGVFTTSFGNASPARITGNVDHRRKSPTDTYGRSLNSCHPCTVFCNLRIERSRLSQWDGKNGFKPVNNIASYQQRDSQPGLLHRYALQRINTYRIYLIQDRPDFTFLNQTTHILNIPIRGNLVHLTDFLFKSHSG